MIDIKEIEEGALIEANDFNHPVREVYNHVRIRGKNLSDEEIRRFTSNIIASMVAEGLVTLVKTVYTQEDETTYSRVSERNLTPEETDLILKEPERWDETDVFSMTDVYELVITDKGRERLFSD